jgi:cytochrome c
LKTAAGTRVDAGGTGEKTGFFGTNCRTPVVLALLGFISTPALANMALSDKYECTDCHKLEVKPGAERKKKEGPSYKEIAKEYKGKKGADKELVDHIKQGSKGIWAKKLGHKTNMDAADDMPVKDAEAMVKWILSL